MKIIECENENEIETHGTVAPVLECLLGITRSGCASPESKQGLVVGTYNPTFGMKKDQKFGLMGQKRWLTVKIHIALTNDPGSDPSTHLNQLTTTCN